MQNAKTVKYHLTSTVILWLQTENEGVGDMSVAGSLTRQCDLDAHVDEQQTHLVNIGRLIEVWILVLFVLERLERAMEERQSNGSQ